MPVRISLLHEIKGILQEKHHSAGVREFPSNETLRGLASRHLYIQTSGGYNKINVSVYAKIILTTFSVIFSQIL